MGAARLRIPEGEDLLEAGHRVHDIVWNVTDAEQSRNTEYPMVTMALRDRASTAALIGFQIGA